MISETSATRKEGEEMRTLNRERTGRYGLLGLLEDFVVLDSPFRAVKFTGIKNFVPLLCHQILKEPKIPQPTRGSSGA
jgi:hypothetical protein